MAYKLITDDELSQMSPLFKGSFGLMLAHFVLRIGGVYKLQHVCDKLCPLEGSTWASSALKELGIDPLIAGLDNLKELAGKPFVTISNHAYGHIDGVMLIDIIGKLDSEYKVMVNHLLGRIKALENSFITVVPNGDTVLRPSTESISGVKTTLLQVRSGHPVGIFPSGAVSDLHPKEGWTISDREWTDQAIKLIAKLNVPIVPVRFFDRNSKFYYALGLIDWKVRLVRLFRELFNKKGTHPRIGIGEIIMPEEINQHNGSTEELKSFLRSSVYGMPLPESFTLRSKIDL